MADNKHPMQPIEYDEHGVIRFKANEIIRWLVNTKRLDLNEIAGLGFSNEDQTQLAQLIGYSVGGFGDLSYVPKKVVRKADKKAARLHAAQQEKGD